MGVSEKKSTSGVHPMRLRRHCCCCCCCCCCCYQGFGSGRFQCHFHRFRFRASASDCRYFTSSYPTHQIGSASPLPKPWSNCEHATYGYRPCFLTTPYSFLDKILTSVISVLLFVYLIIYDWKLLHLLIRPKHTPFNHEICYVLWPIWNLQSIVD